MLKIRICHFFHFLGKSTFEKDENRIKSGAANVNSQRTRQNSWKEFNSVKKR